MQQRLDDTRRRVCQRLSVAGQVTAQCYLQRSRPATYSPSDQMWLHNPRRKQGLSPKLQNAWQRPYTVQEVLSEATYRISPGAWKRSKVVHVDRICTLEQEISRGMRK
ncbi:uncharacterized protein LOC143034201 [Oratosquilla oratoria]|uniref:uncharacterized protein LOC143034201 n=1 Tax=Oratosquilla oratoria TaxID=337810 RepID=UPI003F775352